VKLRSHYGRNANRNEMSTGGGCCGESSRTYSRERYSKHKVGAGEEGRKRKIGETERGAEPTHRHRAHTGLPFRSVQSSPDAMLPHQAKKMDISTIYTPIGTKELLSCRSALRFEL
jgi:hypothetical protein